MICEGCDNFVGQCDCPSARPAYPSKWAGAKHHECSDPAAPPQVAQPASPSSDEKAPALQPVALSDGDGVDSSCGGKLYCNDCPRIKAGYLGCNLHDLCKGPKVIDRFGVKTVDGGQP